METKNVFIYKMYPLTDDDKSLALHLESDFQDGDTIYGQVKYTDEYVLRCCHCLLFLTGWQGWCNGLQVYSGVPY